MKKYPALLFKVAGKLMVDLDEYYHMAEKVRQAQNQRSKSALFLVGSQKENPLAAQTGEANKTQNRKLFKCLIWVSHFWKKNQVNRHLQIISDMVSVYYEQRQRENWRLNETKKESGLSQEEMEAKSKELKKKTKKTKVTPKCHL